MILPWWLQAYQPYQIREVLELFDGGESLVLHGTLAEIAECLVRNRYVVVEQMSHSSANDRITELRVAGTALNDLGQRLLGILVSD